MTERELMQLRMLAEINRKVSKRTWFSDFTSNLAGNAVFDGVVWLASKLIRKL